MSADNNRLLLINRGDNCEIFDLQKGEYVFRKDAIKSGAFISFNGNKIVVANVNGTVSIYDINLYFQKKTISEYFSNKLLPLKKQASLVALDAISQQNNGGPIMKADLTEHVTMDMHQLFKNIPENVREALKMVYKIDPEVFMTYEQSMRKKLALEPEPQNPHIITRSQLRTKNK